MLNSIPLTYVDHIFNYSGMNCRFTGDLPSTSLTTSTRTVVPSFRVRCYGKYRYYIVGLYVLHHPTVPLDAGKSNVPSSNLVSISVAAQALLSVRVRRNVWILP
jgi:hypothetical protein